MWSQWWIHGCLKWTIQWLLSNALRQLLFLWHRLHSCWMIGRDKIGPVCKLQIYQSMFFLCIWTFALKFLNTLIEGGLFFTFYYSSGLYSLKRIFHDQTQAKRVCFFQFLDTVFLKTPSWGLFWNPSHRLVTLKTHKL